MKAMGWPVIGGDRECWFSGACLCLPVSACLSLFQGGVLDNSRGTGLARPNKEPRRPSRGPESNHPAKHIARSRKRTEKKRGGFRRLATWRRSGQPRPVGNPSSIVHAEGFEERM